MVVKTTIEPIYEDVTTEYIDFALAIGAPPQGGEIEFRNITFGGKELVAGENVRSITFYPGSETQGPDPLHAGATGDLTPAYRGIGYVVIERMKVEDFQAGLRVNVEAEGGGAGPGVPGSGGPGDLSVQRCGILAASLGETTPPLRPVQSYVTSDPRGGTFWSNIGPALLSNGSVIDGRNVPGAVPNGYISSPSQFIDGANLNAIAIELNKCTGNATNPCVADANDLIAIIDDVGIPANGNPLTPLRAFFRTLTTDGTSTAANRYNGTVRRLLEQLGTFDDENLQYTPNPGVTAAEIEAHLAPCAQAPPPSIPGQPPPRNPDGSFALYFAHGAINSGFTSEDPASDPDAQVQRRNQAASQRGEKILWYYGQGDVIVLFDGTIVGTGIQVRSGLLTLRFLTWGGADEVSDTLGRYKPFVWSHQAALVIG